LFIKSLELHNWCRFKNLFKTFGDMTSVRAPNGGGKTSFVRAIPYALTGDPGLPGVLEDNIRQSSDLDLSARVVLTLEHHRIPCTVSREIHRGGKSAKATLAVAGEPVVYGATKIKQRLLGELLQVEESLLNDYVFVPQWGMFAFVEQKAADRAKAFAKLFGVEKAERIWNALDVRLPPAAVTVDKQAVLATMSSLDQELVGRTSKLTTDRERLLALRATAQDRRTLLASCSTRSVHTQSILRFRDREREVLRLLNIAITDLSAAEHHLTNSEAKVTDMAVSAKEAESVAMRWDSYVNESTRLAGLEVRLIEEEKALENNLRPDEPAIYIDKLQQVESTRLISELAVSLAVINQFIKSCDPDKGVAACPTCGTPTAQPDLANRIEKAKASISHMVVRLDSLQMAVKVSQAHDYALSIYKHREELLQASFKRVLDDCEKQKSLVPPKPTASRESASQVLKEYRTRCDILTGLRDNLTKTKVRESQLVGALESVRRSIDEVTATIHSMPEVTDQMFAQLSAEVEELEKLSSSVVIDENAIKLLYDRMAECEEALVKFKKEHDFFWTVKRTESYLSDLRGVFHRDRAPAEVSRYFLQTIRADVDELLDRFNAPFRMIGVSDLDLMVQFADGRQGPASRMLSGGEKMLLALAFRVSLGLLFAGDLGVLCLDEPTVGLDANNVKCVAIALDRLREFGKSRGLQFILITHEASLDNLCDQVIDLTNLTEAA
jgi:DNA repair exonuclease SbcCD ATPase subunit